jgi:hypothetical protein
VTARERSPRRNTDDSPVAKSPDSPRAILQDQQVRASYFIARHQWLTVRKQWTCLAADRDHGWTTKDFDTFVTGHQWKFARTMPENPHEYTLRRNTKHLYFDQAVRYIRGEGVIEYFAGKPYTMLHAGSHKYWTMGAPLVATALINRKVVDMADVLEKPSGALPFFPFLPSSVDQLPRADCFDIEGKAADVDDFEFFVKLIRECGHRILGQWYLEIDGYLYWTRGVPEKAQAIHRARRPA